MQHFIVFFGGFELALSQFPDIHSLRWLNALCTLSTIGFATTVIGVTVYSGRFQIPIGIFGKKTRILVTLGRRCRDQGGSEHGHVWLGWELV